jgi:hypothetical protein
VTPHPYNRAISSRNYTKTQDALNAPSRCPPPIPPPLTTPAQAIVLNGQILRQTGQGEFNILKTETPFAVGEDNSTQTHLYAFNKDQNIVLDAPIRVDIGGVEGRITAGTEVVSH